MMLSTFDPLMRTAVAQFDYGCAGNGDHQIIREFSQSCDRAIRKGEQYIETLELVKAVRVTPRSFNVVSRHCAHCALTFFPKVTVVGSEEVAA